jgi:hypothetical protein
MGKGPCCEGDWQSKFAGAKETFLVRRNVPAGSRFLSWSLLGNDCHENSSRAGDFQSAGMFTSGYLLLTPTY